MSPPISPAPIDDLTKQQLATALQLMNAQPRQAETILRAILARDANQPDALHLLGMTLRNLHRGEEGAALVLRSVERQPQSAGWWNNASVLLREIGDLDRAADAAQHAIAIDPLNPQFHYNLAHVMRERAQFKDALALYDRALQLDPNYAKAHYSRGITLLTLGDFANGWPEYEWRWRKSDYTTQPRSFAQPMWDGSPLSGKTILLHAEQGLGDSIQFARYAPLVCERGGRLIVEAHPPLVELMKSLANVDHGVEHVVPTRSILPPFDLHAPLMSLPAIFHTDLSTIPASVPYLSCDQAKVRAWTDRLKSIPRDKRRIGICWAGNPKHGGDKLRSVPPNLLASLANQRVALISLQRDQPAPANVTDYSQELRSFSDTAALIANLDLVITVDTSIAHLAGAIGAQCWTLIPFSPDWRWMLNRTDSPWYPTMRLVRQSSRGDWTSVMKTISHELENL